MSDKITLKHFMNTNVVMFSMTILKETFLMKQELFLFQEMLCTLKQGNQHFNIY